MTTALLSRDTALGSRSARLKVAVPPSRSPLDRSLPTADLRIHEVIEAIEGNHLAIEGFLQRVLHQPWPAEFASAVQRPGYSPAERFVIKRPSDRRLVAHLQLRPYMMRFGLAQIPVVRLCDLAVQAEYEIRGCGDQMLLAAEQGARRSGAMVMMTRGSDEEALGRCGWVSLGDDPVSIVSPQRLLGQLPASREPASPFYANSLPRGQVRLGRLTDIDAMRRLYDAQTARAYGSQIRDEAYWSWLVSRRAHNQIYLFTENEETLAYVVLRGASVIELMDSTDDDRGAARVLKYVGADAIEQGRHSLRIHAPLTERVHTWSDLAGGQVFAGSDELTWMVKIVSPRSLLRRMAAELHHRRFSRLKCEVSLRIGNEDLLLRSGVRSLRVTRGLARNHRLEMSHRAAAQLLLGYRDADELAACGQLKASSSKALESARLLFPMVNMWRPCWDELPVIKS